MSFKDFISNNIIDLGESTKKAVPPVKTTPQQHTAKSFINPVQNQIVSVDDSSAIPYSGPIGNKIESDDLEAARDQIVKLLDSKNQPGIDLHEFVVAKNGMTALPEPDRYKVAFNSLSPIGLTKDILNSSGAFYISVVDNELKNFQNQFAQVNKSDVDDKKTAITTKQQQMVQLSEQINKLNGEIKTMSAEVAESEQTLNSKSNAFAQACNEAKATIQTELDKISQYIQ